MKNFGRNPLLALGGTLVTALWLFTSTAQAASPGAAQVKKVVGTATYTDAKGGGPIKEGDILMQGATITTGAGSYVDLDMGVNGNALRVEADSTLTLNKLDYTRAGEVIVNTELEVKKGSTVANVVNKLSKASKYEIKTPAGVAGIRGTVLRAGTTRIVCLIGTVSFVPVAGGGVQLVIKGGAGFSVGNAGVQNAPAVETTGLARTTVSLTANTVANMVSQVVQQFTAAIAAEAAKEAGKAGGEAGATAAAAEAAAVAKTVLAQLVAEVKLAAAAADPKVAAVVQQAATQLSANADAVGATAAASAAAAAVVNNGGNATQAKAAATQAAQQATADPTVAQKAANNVTTGAINQAIQAKTQGGTANVTETLVNNTQSATGTPTGGTSSTLPGTGTKTGVETKIGETTIFISPAGAGTDTATKK